MSVAEKPKYYNERMKESQLKYHRTHLKQIKFALSIEHDADILAMLDSVPNKQGYIKELIRADIAARAKSFAQNNDVAYNMKYDILAINETKEEEIHGC